MSNKQYIKPFLAHIGIKEDDEKYKEIYGYIEDFIFEYPNKSRVVYKRGQILFYIGNKLDSSLNLHILNNSILELTNNELVEYEPEYFIGSDIFEGFFANGYLGTKLKISTDNSNNNNNNNNNNGNNNNNW